VSAGLELERVFRLEAGRVLATLIGLLGDFELAEEALQEACALALETWPRDGQPHNPRAWLVKAGQRRAIDALRRQKRYAQKLDTLRLERESMTSSSRPKARG